MLKSDATPPSDKDSPHIGSLLSKVRPNTNGLPSFVTLPWKALHPAAPGGEAPGQHGGWLGPSYDGLLLTGDPNAADWKPAGLSLPADMPLARFESRYQLLQTLDAQRQAADAAVSSAPTARLQDHQVRAHDLLSSPHVRQAFDLAGEPAQVRERYGRNIHGQSVLMARRSGRTRCAAGERELAQRRTQFLGHSRQ